MSHATNTTSATNVRIAIQGSGPLYAVSSIRLARALEDTPSEHDHNDDADKDVGNPRFFAVRPQGTGEKKEREHGRNITRCVSFQPTREYR